MDYSQTFAPRFPRPGRLSKGSVSRTVTSVNPSEKCAHVIIPEDFLNNLPVCSNGASASSDSRLRESPPPLPSGSGGREPVTQVGFEAEVRMPGAARDPLGLIVLEHSDYFCPLLSDA